MDIGSLTSPAAQPQSGAASATIGKAGATLDSDFQTFLTMLTAQMQNQDPLNPVDSTEFASQLAAFSTVEQQVLTNDLLTGLGRQLGVMGMGQLQGWIGMTAQAEMPVAYDGTPVALSVPPTAGADHAQLIVRDAAGGIIDQREMPVDGGPLLWPGSDVDLPQGVYEITVDSFKGQELLGSQPVQSRARIAEARLTEGRTILVMEGGQEIPAADIVGLSDPDIV